MPDPDLDALRELSRLLRNAWIAERRQDADSLDAVLALVDEQAKRIETLESTMRDLLVDLVIDERAGVLAERLQSTLDRIGEALAGSPAEKETNGE